jgi:hypothetical protein
MFWSRAASSAGAMMSACAADRQNLAPDAASFLMLLFDDREV